MYQLHVIEKSKITFLARSKQEFTLLLKLATIHFVIISILVKVNTGWSKYKFMIESVA